MKRWEDALGIDLFEWKSTDTSQCATGGDSSLGLASVIVYTDSVEGYRECGAESEDDYDAHMCVRGPEGYPTLHTLYSQARIVINDVEAGYPSLNSVRIRRDLTHEFGHVISLADYYCNPNFGRTPEDRVPPGARTLMNSTHGYMNGLCNSTNHKPTQVELDDYCAAYLPEAPGKRDAVPGTEDGKVTIHWNPQNVHVEMGFEVLRWDGTAWVSEGTVNFDEDSADLENQPGGQQYYAVASITKAFPHEGEDHFRGPSSAMISVLVPGEASSTPSRPSSRPATEGCSALPRLPTRTLSASGGEGGSVTCTVFGGPVGCEGEVAQGTNIAVSALAADGYAFDSWDGDGASSDDTPHVRTVRMDANRTVVALP